MSIPKTTISLCNVPELDLNYTHTFDFSTGESQLNYFTNKVVKRYDDYMYIRKNRAIRVHGFIEDLELCNYLFYRNNGKYYYCFIKEKEYINDNLTELIIETDVMQTYLFNFTILDSFVDRCHVPRWINGLPTDNYEDEGLEFGEHIEVSRETVYSYDENYNYIICSNVPIGKVDDPFKHFGMSTGGDNTQSNGDWENGVMSSKGFRFMKGYEGFGAYSYNDSAGNPTIGYGITLHGHPKEYNNLKAKQPITEEEGARVSFEVKTNSYGKPLVNRLKQLGITKQQQFDALIDLAYNCGTGVILNDNSLTRAIRNSPNDEGTIRPIWEKFYTSDGHNILSGLVARRKAEANIYFNGNYEYRPIGVVNVNGVITGNLPGDGWLPTDLNSDDVTDNDTVKNKYGLGFKPTTGVCTAGHPRYPSGGVHTGVDIANNEGTPIYAWRSGIVRSVGASYGIGIVIDHSDKTSTAIYGHCSKSLVNAGDRVKKGQKIGLMGSTGNSTGNHLHFEIRPYQGGYGTDVHPWEGIKVGDKV